MAIHRCVCASLAENATQHDGYDEDEPHDGVQTHDDDDDDDEFHDDVQSHGDDDGELCGEPCAHHDDVHHAFLEASPY